MVAALGRLGIVVEGANEDALTAVAHMHPVVPLILAHREASKKAGTYGIGFVQHVNPATGRIHAAFRQIGSRAGRMACTDPNLQNVPRQREYRACFRPAEGMAIVKADYSGIELRLAAVIAGDDSMLDAFRAGADLHRRTAASVLGIPEADITKEQRQLAKALGFGLIYGMGAQRLMGHALAGYGVRLTEQEAIGHRNRFFATYQGLRRWHSSQPKGAIDTRTLARRVRRGVERFTWKVNTPVQGSGTDGLKLALGRLWLHRREAPTARLVNVVHDEIVAECPVEDAPLVAGWLRRHMTQAMSEIVAGKVPIEVEATIAADWAGTPLDLTTR
jgi:DNA polymerase-1